MKDFAGYWPYGFAYEDTGDPTKNFAGESVTISEDELRLHQASSALLVACRHALSHVARQLTDTDFNGYGNRVPLVELRDELLTAIAQATSTN